MWPPAPDINEIPDATLVAMVTGSDAGPAIGELWRRHIGAAVAAARSVRMCAEPYDAACDAFVAMLRAVRGGRGPRDGGVEAYLCVAARRAARRRRPRADLPLEDRWPSDGPPVDDLAMAGAIDVERVRGWDRLPGQWQQVLWWTVVCGQTPAEVGRRLSMRPNTVAVIAHRARVTLRRSDTGDGSWEAQTSRGFRAPTSQPLAS